MLQVISSAKRFLTPAGDDRDGLVRAEKHLERLQRVTPCVGSELGVPAIAA
jgi:hypothetical protein